MATEALSPSDVIQELIAIKQFFVDIEAPEQAENMGDAIDLIYEQEHEIITIQDILVKEIIKSATKPK